MIAFAKIQKKTNYFRIGTEKCVFLHLFFVFQLSYPVIKQSCFCTFSDVHHKSYNLLRAYPLQDVMVINGFLTGLYLGVFPCNLTPKKAKCLLKKPKREFGFVFLLYLCV